MPHLSEVHGQISATRQRRAPPCVESARDPAITAIEDYWKALKVWRAADQRLKRLQKKLALDVTRLPRVQVSVLLRGKDNAGVDIKEPIYAHSEWAIKEHVQKECKTMLSIWAGPGWVYDPKAKSGFMKIVSERARKQRPIIRAKYKLREKMKIAEFVADRDTLYAQQRAAGWRQAVEAEECTKSRVYRLRYRAQSTKPSTVAGAVALIEFINAAHRSQTNSKTGREPYGLGNYYPAHIAKNVARFLSENGVALNHSRRAN